MINAAYTKTREVSSKLVPVLPLLPFIQKQPHIFLYIINLGQLCLHIHDRRHVADRRLQLRDVRIVYGDAPAPLGVCLGW